MTGVAIHIWFWFFLSEDSYYWHSLLEFILMAPQTNTGRICRSYYKKIQFLILFNQKSPLKFIENASNNNKYTINHIHLSQSLVTLMLWNFWWERRASQKTHRLRFVFILSLRKTDDSLSVFLPVCFFSVTSEWQRWIWFMVNLLLLEAFSINLRGDFWLNKMRNCIFL